MPIRRPSSSRGKKPKSRKRKLKDFAKRASKSIAKGAVSIALLPLSITGELVKYTGEKMDESSKRRTTEPPPYMIDRREPHSIWIGHAMKPPAVALKIAGDIIKVPVVVWQDFTDTDERTEIDHKMTQQGWTPTEYPDQEDLPHSSRPHRNRVYVSPNPARTPEEGAELLSQYINQ